MRRCRALAARPAPPAGPRRCRATTRPARAAPMFAARPDASAATRPYVILPFVFLRRFLIYYTRLPPVYSRQRCVLIVSNISRQRQPPPPPPIHAQVHFLRFRIFTAFFILRCARRRARFFLFPPPGIHFAFALRHATVAVDAAPQITFAASAIFDVRYRCAEA